MWRGMSHARQALFIGALFALLAPALADELVSGLPKGLEAGGDGVVASVIDGDSLRLADGRTVRMVGIQAPKLPKGRPNFAEWPLAREAQAALSDLVRGRTVS